MNARHGAVVPERQLTLSAPRRRWMPAARLWLLGVTGAVVLAVCTTALLLWGMNGPAYLLDLIAVFCG